MGEELKALVERPTSDPAPQRWRQYISAEQLLDPWGNEYQYLHPGVNGTVDVYSMGADGRLGGDGVNADIGNWNLDS